VDDTNLAQTFEIIRSGCMINGIRNVDFLGRASIMGFDIPHYETIVISDGKMVFYLSLVYGQSLPQNRAKIVLFHWISQRFSNHGDPQ
jgi:hypothetical protein